MKQTLDLPTLVLNKHWTPVHVTAVRHALALAYTGRAHVVCPLTYKPHSFGGWVERGILNGTPRIHGVTFEIEAPEIIVLGRYAKLPPRGVVFNRRNLHRRDQNTCQYCGARLASESLTIDHVVPISRGGKTAWENCVLACHRCNGRKANRTPQEARMKPLHEPGQPAWSPRYATYARNNRPKSWDSFIPRGELEAVGV